MKQSIRIPIGVEIIVEKDEDSYYVSCPTLPGIHIDGKTERQAVARARTAIALYVYSLIVHDKDVCRSSPYGY